MGESLLKSLAGKSAFVLVMICGFVDMFSVGCEQRVHPVYLVCGNLR